MSRLSQLISQEKLNGRERGDLEKLFVQLEANVAAIDPPESMGSTNFKGHTTHHREAVFLCRASNINNRVRGIKLVNPANTKLLGHIVMRDNASGDLVLGIADVADASTRTYISLTNANAGEIIFTLENNVGVFAFKEGATRRDFSITKPDDKDLSIGLHSSYTIGILDSDGEMKIGSQGNLDNYATQGMMALEGNVSPLHVTVNPVGRDIDFYVEGDTVTDLLKTDAANEQVSVGGFFNLKLVSELTISSGAITLTGSFHNVDTEGDAGSDDLDTINGGQQEGNIILLKTANDARDVQLTENGNILIDDAAAVTLATTAETFMARWDAGRSKWCQIYKASP